MEHTVLLVDDDQNILHGLSRALHHQPYLLLTVRCAEEAQLALKSHRVDVIVVDERMPGISGTELLAWVARNFPDVIRIMLTGHADTDTAIRAINEGAVYQFFTKPCDEVQLALAIRKALDRAELLRENRRLAALVQGNAGGGAPPALGSDDAGRHFPAPAPAATPEASPTA